MFQYFTKVKQAYKNGGMSELFVKILRFIKRKYGIAEEKLTYKIGQKDPSGSFIAKELPDTVNPSVIIPFTDNTAFDFEKTAVIAHVFYVDLFEEMLNYIDNIPIDIGLFISTDTEEKKKDLEEILLKRSKHYLECEIRVLENRGRDIAPQFVGFADVYERFPIFIHVHTKKSPHFSGGLDTWRTFLMNSLLGNREIVASNLKLLSASRVGVVYPEHFPIIKQSINWGLNYDIVCNLLKKIGVRISTDHILEFPSGSMYWGKSKAIQKILDLKLSFDSFPEEKGQLDGTLAHAIERALLYFVEASGFQWVRVKCEQSSLPRVELPAFRPLLLSAEEIIGAVQKTFPETRSFLPAIHENSQTRLNLIVTSAIEFNEMAIAIKVFASFSIKHPEVDCRVIVTGTALSKKLQDTLSEYEIQFIGEEKRASRVILDCSDRSFKSLEITQNDVFLATAWWTAQQAFELQNCQKMFFGSAPAVIYLIQDFEPGFYGGSARALLAEATYKKPEDTIAIINSEELADYMLQKYNFLYSCVLPSTLNPDITRLLAPKPRERTLLFHSCPSVARTCFEIGMDGITLWAARNPEQARNWTLHCIGEDFKESLADHLPNVTISGKMPMDEYASCLSKASVGLSLMLSPHPGYFPLEMAHSGILTLSNNYKNKHISRRSDLITGIDCISAETIGQSLEILIDQAENQMIGKTTVSGAAIKSLDMSAPIFDAGEVLAQALKSMHLP